MQRVLLKNGHLAETNMRKRFKEEKIFFAVDFFLLESRVQLRLVDSACRQCGKTHAVADKDDHVLGQVGVDVPARLQRSQDLLLTNLLPMSVI